MNQTILIGRLVADPVVNVTTSGKSYCKFKVAVDRRVKHEGQPAADFPSCTAWGKNADNIGKYLKKGSMVGIRGSLQTGSYQKNGATIYTTDVLVDEVKFLGASKGNNSAAAAEPQAEPLTEAMPDGFDAIDEDVPF